MRGIRKIVKYFVALLLYYSGLLALYDWFRRKFTGQPHYVILMYHRVLENPCSENVYSQPGLSVCTDTFDRQLEYIKSKYAVLTLEKFGQTLDDDRKSSEPTAIITFDDGWRDNYTDAYPVLKRHGLKATIFVTTDYVGTTKPFWFLMIKWILTEGNLISERVTEIVADIAEASPSESEILAELVHIIKTSGLDTDKIIEACKKLELDTLDKLIREMLVKSRLSMDYWETNQPTLSWEQAGEMSKYGIEIASHGCTHRILTLLPANEIDKELVASKAIIEHQLGKAVTSFAYPNGNFDDEIKSSVEQAGYSCAVATSFETLSSRSADRFALKRVAIHNGVSAGLFGKFSRAMFAWHLLRDS